MMEKTFMLAELFLEHVRVRGVVVPDDAAELDGVLRRAHEAGREPWPQVALPADVFVRHLAQRLPENTGGDPLAQVLGKLVLPDFYLACACVNKVHGAVELLERHYLEKLRSVLASLHQSDMSSDDVCQQVRIQLLMGTTQAGPQLAHYRGEGKLFSWIMVMAMRMVRKEVATRREAPDENVLAALKDLPTLDPDGELDLIKRTYRHEFEQAVRDAFASLSEEQRHLLRLHYADRLSTVAMMKVYPVDQSTISRWLKSARQAVYKKTKHLLKERLRLSSGEFKSLLNVLRSQLDLRLSQILNRKEGED